MVTRRSLVGGGMALAGTAALPQQAEAAEAGAFVTRNGTGFRLRGKPYRYAGANMWYAAWIGAPEAPGDRDRLRRELDRLAATGVTNLRIAASAEEGPLEHSVTPGFRGKGTDWNANLLRGLDFALAELARRDMKAVLYLTNFWEWSGGMMAYLWYATGRYMNAGDPDHPWPEFPNAVSEFYRNAQAVGMYRDWIRALLRRTNAETGTRYRDDPTIMAWQLANEPRPAGDMATAEPVLAAFHHWVGSTARLIKSLAPRHLVSTGSEGLQGTLGSRAVYEREHAIAEIDYCTAHIWPLNWNWVDDHDLAGSEAEGAAKVGEYFARMSDLARKIGKPLVFEEFGYPRDGGGYDPAGSTRFKDAFYSRIYDAIERDIASGGPVCGSNFWAWNGEGRAAHGDHRWRPGDPLLGDPPHEPQGWYGVFDSDDGTRAVVKAHADALRRV
ncbi:glycoside hydrolase 5 family protein [Stakelama saccharophila]|uniref:mannan endo-1,4-beta-mannosidase n=1 Tax=Stakelama saccharophila TaxID=3075605 RepID=A0ABZ0B9G4_9SPHN|nr:cellulase family glycosylhydrolase [Stakelama sp. W311]WNO52944.1 cellulase family glycosylhydrolase [Stakelama sp. W311]